jgi:16S rRNA (cytidine1402-2'-O)-methyltransferase
MMTMAEHLATTRDQTPSGTLYVVATPIGNLDDLAPRARDTLGQVDIIAAEDTRVSRRLLADRDGPVRMISVNEHSEERVVDQLIDSLGNGKQVALVSDAGTPLVSDPGFRLVAAAHEAGIRVCPIPGPCAAIAAMSVAGLPSDRFHFEGFLPARKAARTRRLLVLSELPDTLIFYVPARDLPAVLDDLMATFGPERRATLARELTKLHETVRCANVDQLKQFVADDTNQLRGEAVLVVAGNSKAEAPVSVPLLVRELAAELPPSRAARVLARLTHLSRQQAWDQIQALSSDS